MTVALTLIVKDETEVLPRSLPSYLPFIDSWQIIDTGSVDGTPDLIEAALGHLPGELHHREWTDYATARNQLLDVSRGTADWLLTVDADMEAEIHPDLKEWLEPDPDPDVGAWMVNIRDGGDRWLRPCLIRGDFAGVYVGCVHEYLNTSGVKIRPLQGLTLHHFGHAVQPEGKFERYIELLTPEAEAGDPRAVFYLAESMRFAGRTEEAAEQYERRAAMASWEEEAWFAAYMAARLRRDVGALLTAYYRRPWRPEPLRWAARFVTEDGPADDILFIQDG